MECSLDEVLLRTILSLATPLMHPFSFYLFFLSRYNVILLHILSPFQTATVKHALKDSTSV